MGDIIIKKANKEIILYTLYMKIKVKFYKNGLENMGLKKLKCYCEILLTDFMIILKYL